VTFISGSRLLFSARRFLLIRRYEDDALDAAAAVLIQRRQVLGGKSQELRAPGRIRHSHAENSGAKIEGPRFLGYCPARRQRPGQQGNIFRRSMAHGFGDNLLEIGTGVLHREPKIIAF